MIIASILGSGWDIPWVFLCSSPSAIALPYEGKQDVEGVTVALRGERARGAT